ncbi:MAG: ATP-dependent DNA helicase [Actinomycetes bacterium]
MSARARVAIETPEDLQSVLPRRLDDDQLLAATAPLGPGLVVAGAGSGKTTLMAARVVWLVGSGQVPAECVLGLTFTNKAAAELGSRVRGWLDAAGVTPSSAHPGGPDQLPGHRPGDVPGDAEPTVSTYHAFAGRIVRDHGLRVGVEPDSRLITQATRFMLAMRAMREVEGDFTALEVGPDFIAERLLDLAGELAEHLVTLDQVRARDLEIIASVDRAAKQTQNVSKVASTARQRLELTRLVEAYTRAKRDRDLVDFDDQIALAARIVSERPEVVATYRDDFKVVLLDEYQDTSVAQRVLLTRLFGNGHPVTAVGDPFQAIYGWRGASVANIDDFGVHFARADGSAAAAYALPVSYRSGGRLLALANTIATELRDQHPAVQPLRVPAEVDPEQGWVRCGVLPTAAEELDFVVEQVQRARDDTAPSWGEIAVLVRQNVVIAPLYERLTAAGIPVEVVGLRGLLTLPGVADVVAVLQAVHDPTANPAMVRILAGPRWRIGPRDLRLLGQRAAALAHVDVERPRDEDGVQALARALDKAVADGDPAELVSLLDAVEDPGDLPYSSAARERFARLAAEIDDLRSQQGEALVDLVDRVIVTTGLDVEAAVAQAARGTAQRDALAALVDVAAGFRDLDGESTLGSFLAYLVAAEQEEGGLDLPTPTFGDSVKLMSVHRAKGLEWDVVVLPELTKTVFPSTRGRSRYTQAAQVMPVSLRGDADRMPEVADWTNQDLTAYAAELKAEDALEERRLGYVAITRARRLLVASTSWWGPTQKTRRGPSEFFQVVHAQCVAGHGEVVVSAAEPADDDTNPVIANLGTVEVPWPAKLHPDRLQARQESAAAVRAAMAGLADGGLVDGGLVDGGLVDDELLTDIERVLVDGWDHDLELLLAELVQASSAHAHDVTLPAALSASQVLGLGIDPDGLAGELARPMPRAPQPAARRGTRFHAWVEARYAQQPLLAPDELPGSADSAITDDDDLTALQVAFERGPYADRVPHRLEVPFSLVLGGRVVRGRIDAVYRTEDGATGHGYEVVDWKTNRAHDADPLQLAIYRLAWAEIAGCDVGSVGAAFAYVRDGAIVWPPGLPDRAGLEALLAAAR